MSPPTFDHAVAVHCVHFLIGVGTSASSAADGGKPRTGSNAIAAGGDHCRQRQLCRRHRSGPPLVNWGTQFAGWRTTHIASAFSAGSDDAGAVVLRAQIAVRRRDHENAPPPRSDLRLSTNTLTAAVRRQHFLLRGDGDARRFTSSLLRDLGYGVARGAEMLSLMMAFGIVSRIGSSGFLATGSAASGPC